MMGMMDKKKQGGGLAAILLAARKKPSDGASDSFKPSGADEEEPSQKAAAMSAMRAFMAALQGTDTEGALRAFVTLQDAAEGLDLDMGEHEDEASEPGTDPTQTFGG